MPVKYFVMFLGFWVVCLVVAILGASTEAGLFAYIPSRSGTMIHPPNSTTVLIGIGAVGALFLFFQDASVWVALALSISLVLGLIVGQVKQEWTPSVIQYPLTAFVAGLTAYGFKLRYYLD